MTPLIKRTPGAGDTARGMDKGTEVPVSTVNSNEISDAIWANAQDLARARKTLAEMEPHMPVLVVSPRSVQDPDTGKWDTDPRGPLNMRFRCLCGWTPVESDASEDAAEARYLREHLGIVFPAIPSDTLDGVDFLAGESICSDHEWHPSGVCQHCGGGVDF